MFGELPKLFDRNFVVGFFLPVVIFITISGFLLSQYGFAANMVTFAATDLLIGTTITGLLSWIGGIVLLVFNRVLYRTLEGYEKFNPIQLFIGFERKRYANVKQELKTINEQKKRIEENKKKKRKLPLKLRRRRSQLMEQLAVEFPDKEDFLLATPFGNILRSFEVYPRVMYGLESIYAWERLLAVIPKDYMDLMDNAKAQVDLWVNLSFVFVLLQVEYIALTYIFGSSINLWIVLLFIALGTLALLGATSSAKVWGRFVKSSFDMFAPKMRETLGFAPPKNRAEEIQQWAGFSQAIVFRKPKQMPELKKQETKKSKPAPLYQSSFENSNVPRRIRHRPKKALHEEQAPESKKSVSSR